MNNKVALVTSKELWSEFSKMKQELKEEMLYELKVNSERKLYTRKELAKHLKVTQQTIINWSSRDILNPLYVQGRVYYKAEEVNNLLKQ
ncbi:helix-turn-helix domain-containing protein [Flavobacteriales bacterium]|jgi:DNA-binding XRE family transcriptional regulator|nr:helix-turn-helix domain-containing protein [Flavobacteriales bacterium]